MVPRIQETHILSPALPLTWFVNSLAAALDFSFLILRLDLDPGWLSKRSPGVAGHALLLLLLPQELSLMS